jgi:hypothetical protein
VPYQSMASDEGSGPQVRVADFVATGAINLVVARFLGALVSDLLLQRRQDRFADLFAGFFDWGEGGFVIGPFLFE